MCAPRHAFGCMSGRWVGLSLGEPVGRSVVFIGRALGRPLGRSTSVGRSVVVVGGRSVGPSVGCSVVAVGRRRRSVDRSVDRSASSSVAAVDRSVGRSSIGRSAHRSSVGRLVGRSVGNLVSSSQWAHMGYLNSDLGFTCLQRAPRSVTQERPRVTARGAFFSASEGPGKGPRQPRDCSKRFPRGPQDRSRKRRFA